MILHKFESLMELKFNNNKREDSKHVSNTNGNETPSIGDEQQSNISISLEDERLRARRKLEETSREDGATRDTEQGNSSISNNSDAMDRERANSRVKKLIKDSRREPNLSPNNRGSSNNSNDGTQANGKPKRTTKRATKPKVIYEHDNSDEFVKLDRLYPEQKQDVEKAQKRFEQGRGILFTNGTGTGKTATGSGIIRTFYDKNPNSKILIVTPSDTKNKDWVEECEKFVGLKVYILKSIKDKGKNISITIYANFAQNASILNNEYDLIVYDESHKLLSDNSGKHSTLTMAHYLNANHSNHVNQKERVKYLNNNGYGDARSRIEEILLGGDKKRFNPNEIGGIIGGLYRSNDKQSMLKIMENRKPYSKLFNRDEKLEAIERKFEEMDIGFKYKIIDSIFKKDLSDDKYEQLKKDNDFKIRYYDMKLTPLKEEAKEYAEATIRELADSSLWSWDEEQKSILADEFIDKIAKSILKDMDKPKFNHISQKEKEEVCSLVEKLKKIEDGWLEYKKDKEFEANTKTKVVFLSATPYKGHFSLEYTDEFIHDIGIGKEQTDFSYNSGSSRERFYVNNFGYSMRYNKLNQPKAEINLDALEIMFTDEAIKNGAMSGRKLDINFDYSRRFIKLDELEHLGEGIKSFYDKKYHNLSMFASAWFFGHPHGEQMFEGLIAEAIIPRIKKHLAKGRKLVIFHKYAKASNRDVFDLRTAKRSYYDRQNDVMVEKRLSDDKVAKAELLDWEKENGSKYMGYESKESVPQLIKRVFGDKAVFFNGKVSKVQRRKDIKRFNTEDDIKIIVVQEQAGKEGISLHDTDGIYQRVLINCSKPTDPISAIQIEGRIYRLGNKSNAIFEYPILGISQEKWDFVNKINRRVGTTENLAMGSGARGLSRAFKEGYLNADNREPSDEDGIGTKEEDYAQSDTSLTPFERAKALYDTATKGRAKNGTDFFATPDPLGYMMGEWANTERGESMLEPSAGHGAIARYFPEGREHTFIEQNTENRDKLLGVVSDSNNIREERSFEDYPISYKHDAVVMNPPYGKQSKMAWEHTLKAMHHLRDGGRVVSLCPNAPTMKKRIDNWLESEESNGYEYVAKIDMPDVTFKRVGTSVMTSVYIFDKIPKYQEPKQRYTKHLDFSHVGDIQVLFEKIEQVGAIDRYTPYDDDEIEEIENRLQIEREEDRERNRKENEAIENHFGKRYEISKSDATILRRLARGTSTVNFNYSKIEEFEDFTKDEFLNTINHEAMEVTESL